VLVSRAITAIEFSRMAISPVKSCQITERQKRTACLALGKRLVLSSQEALASASSEDESAVISSTEGSPAAVNVSGVSSRRHDDFHHQNAI
jgi:hypothetical protein